KRGRRYDIFLPVTYNDGRLIEDEKFIAVEQLLVERFGGMTEHPREMPLKGMWRVQTQLFVDRVVLIIVIDVHQRGNIRYFTHLKTQLMEQFDQEDILITETQLRVY